MAFSPCPECSRHVRLTDAACPFCGSDAARPVPKQPRRSTQRVTRAALFFAGVLGASACGDDDTRTIYGGPPTSQGDEDDPGGADIYGGPPADDPGESEEVEEEPVGDDEAMPVEAYGAPAPPEDP